jgi:hypothetical protein
MQPRLSYEDFTKAAPAAHAGPAAFARAADESALEKSLADHSPRRASNKAYAASPDHVSESAAMFPSVAIAAIDGWNRPGVALRFAPPPLWAPGK